MKWLPYILLVFIAGCSATGTSEDMIDARLSIQGVFYENHGLFTVHESSADITTPIWIDYQSNIDIDPAVESIIESDTISVVIEEIDSPHYRIIDFN